MLVKRSTRAPRKRGFEHGGRRCSQSFRKDQRISLLGVLKPKCDCFLIVLQKASFVHSQRKRGSNLQADRPLGIFLALEDLMETFLISFLLKNKSSFLGLFAFLLRVLFCVL